MTYQQTLKALAASGEATAVALWRRVDDPQDDFDDEMFTATLGASLAIHNARAQSLSQLAFSAQAMIATGTAVAVAGLPVRRRHRTSARRGCHGARRSPRSTRPRSDRRTSRTLRAPDNRTRDVRHRDQRLPPRRRMDPRGVRRADANCAKTGPMTARSSGPARTWRSSRLRMCAGTRIRPRRKPMTDTDTSPQIDVETPTNEPVGDPMEVAAQDESEPDTFPRSYVEELRRESQRYRERAQKGEGHAARLHTELVKATGKLADPTDLPFDEAHLDEPGGDDQGRRRPANPETSPRITATGGRHRPRRDQRGRTRRPRRDTATTSRIDHARSTDADPPPRDAAVLHRHRTARTVLQGLRRATDRKAYGWHRSTPIMSATANVSTPAWRCTPDVRREDLRPIPARLPTVRGHPNSPLRQRFSRFHPGQVIDLRLVVQVAEGSRS